MYRCGCRWSDPECRGVGGACDSEHACAICVTRQSVSGAGVCLSTPALTLPTRVGSLSVIPERAAPLGDRHSGSHCYGTCEPGMVAVGRA